MSVPYTTPSAPASLHHVSSGLAIMSRHEPQGASLKGDSAPKAQSPEDESSQSEGTSSLSRHSVLTVSLEAASRDDGRNKAQTLLEGHLFSDSGSATDIQVVAESFALGHYLAVVRLSGGQSDVAAISDTPSPGAIQQDETAGRTALWHRPAFALFIAADETGRWGLDVGPAISKPLTLVPIKGDADDHDCLHPGDILQMQAGVIPDTLTTMLDKYRTDTLVLVTRHKDKSLSLTLIQGERLASVPFDRPVGTSLREMAGIVDEYINRDNGPAQ